MLKTLNKTLVSWGNALKNAHDTIMKKYYNRIEFWILIFFLIRLIGITNPPLEIGHNWRQVTGLMVARNYLEVDANILYPRIDDNNGNSGIIGMEFPSLNYLHFLVSKVFGYSHWYGRLINLIISSLGLFFFYKLICLSGFKERIAFISTIFLSTSIWFAFSRKMMPDTYSISLMFIGLYYGLKFLKEKKIFQILIYTIVCSLAILSKIPAGIYFIILLPFLLNKKDNIQQRAILLIFTLIPLALTYIWYFIWNPFLSIEFGNWYNLGKPIKTGFVEIVENLGKALDNFYFDSFSSYIVFSLFISGMVIMFFKREKRMIIAFILPFLVFMVYIFKSGFYFYHHNYYIIPFVPVMAIVAGYALSLIHKKWIFLTVLILGVGESIANQQHDFFIKESEKYKMSIEPIMDQVSQRDDLILINGNGNPQMIYLSHRKGWNCSDEQLLDVSFINKVIDSNCKFIVINKHSNVHLKKLNLSFKTVFENDDFLILETSVTVNRVES
jgi:hypothetical protein